MFRFPPLAALLFAAMTLPAQAGFEQSGATLYEGYPDLEQEYTPGSEFTVYAIVSNSISDRVVYVILREWHGRIVPFGSFECGDTFAPLDSFTNGFRDIRCVSVDGVGNRTGHVLRVKNNAGYEME